MSWIRSERNASTELRLVALLRAGGITGWRRGYRLRLRGQTTDNGRRKPDGGGRTADGGVRMAAERQRNASGVGKDSPPGARRQDLRGQKRLELCALPALRGSNPSSVFRGLSSAYRAAGLRVPEGAAGGVRRRLLLARVPTALHAAEGATGVLGREDRRQPRA